MSFHRITAGYTATTQNVPFLLTFYRSLQKSVQHRLESWKVYGTRCSLRLLRQHLVRPWCIWYVSFHSFLGHIEEQSSTGLLVDFGPSPVPGQNDAASERTIARSLYTKMLQATLPWADSQDLRTFLMGFDAGEQYSAHSGTLQSELLGTDRSSRSSWLMLSENEFRNVPTRLQEMRRAKSPTQSRQPLPG